MSEDHTEIIQISGQRGPAKFTIRFPAERNQNSEVVQVDFAVPRQIGYRRSLKASDRLNFSPNGVQALPRTGRSWHMVHHSTHNMHSPSAADMVATLHGRPPVWRESAPLEWEKRMLRGTWSRVIRVSSVGPYRPDRGYSVKLNRIERGGPEGEFFPVLSARKGVELKTCYTRPWGITPECDGSTENQRNQKTKNGVQLSRSFQERFRTAHKYLGTEDHTALTPEGKLIKTGKCSGGPTGLNPTTNKMSSSKVVFPKYPDVISVRAPGQKATRLILSSPNFDLSHCANSVISAESVCDSPNNRTKRKIPESSEQPPLAPPCCCAFIAQVANCFTFTLGSRSFIIRPAVSPGSLHYGYQLLLMGVLGHT
ncbi:hypothetical protein B0H14DRAFT_2592631 [Mycena olivaceomarginata]|nr:hypothetical protein B0H14DRAFT_2592631 [Mycena olivaceomarginata]